MHLLYLTFGNHPDLHAQAAFSIYSFLREETLLHTINVITDQPFFYNHLQQKVNIIATNAAELKDWEGKNHFFWRVKLKAIEKICALYPNDPVMYLDADTFLINDLEIIYLHLQAGKALMHMNEGPLSGKKSKTEKQMWRQIANKTFGNMLMQPAHCMWNAGVVATPNTQQNKECQLALRICDEMCSQGVAPRLIEQYALSLALQTYYELQEAQNNIVHYWSVKAIWVEKIKAFFLQTYFSQASFHEILQLLAAFDFTKIPIAQRTRNTNVRLKNFADKAFPSQNHVFLFKDPFSKL